MAVELTELAFEVLGKVPATMSSTRLTGEAIVDQVSAASAEASVELTELGFEVVGKVFVVLTPCSLPSTLDFFAYNWANNMTMTTFFDTQVSRAPESVAEERIGAIQRPHRNIEVVWTQSAELGSQDAPAQLIKIHTQLRRSQREPWAIPLYMDMQCSSEDIAVGSTLFRSNEFNVGRFFPNINVVIVNTNYAGTPIPGEFEYNTITARPSTTEFTLGAPTTIAIGAGTVIMPMICAHPVLKQTIIQRNADVWELKVTFKEELGPGALPPIAADLPPNFDTYRGIPIFAPNHNYASPLQIGFLNEGVDTPIGRDRLVTVRGEFSRLRHAFVHDENRVRGWDYIRFFETRLGRLRSFFLVEQLQLFKVTGLSANFIEVAELGLFSEFQKDLQFFGLLLKDGRYFVREVVTSQLIGNTFRVTVIADPALPLGPADVPDVKLAGRAHLTRFETDKLVEQWRTLDNVRLNMPTLSLLQEKDVEL